MKSRNFATIATSCLVLFSLLSVTPLAAASVVLTPNLRASGSESSLNWAGYAVTGSSGTVTTVSGSFVQPSVSCSKKTTYAAFWAGIDGYSDSTVEQAGTLVQCTKGSPVYSAWTEFYPAAPTYATWNPSPGDVISVTVTCSAVSGGASCTATVTDGANSYSTAATVSGAQLANAECITERPAIGGSLTTLANFGTASYGQDNTGVSGTCYATIGGTMQSFGTFSSVASINMVTNNGKTLATTSSLSSDGSSFTVTFGGASSGGHGRP
ncbi:MAG: hypothetical protein JRN21_06005 [Nitrososphaerota archaeon]|nr:hypothetical protein [Nitrososphaerota archaeon]